jgi:exodeoxyribonuclease VII small subunit
MSSPNPGPENNDAGIEEDLNFSQAQTALELSLAELQEGDLDVERMMDLYRRAQGYADRCERLLENVEQEVMAWDPAKPDHPPHPYEP